MAYLDMFGFARRHFLKFIQIKHWKQAPREATSLGQLVSPMFGASCSIFGRFPHAQDCQEHHCGGSLL